jgi:D-sedoheptulose 7-phosphate isomerase
MSHTRIFLLEAASIIEQLDVDAIDRLMQLLVTVRDRGGRLFILGVGGSAANASHAVNDFRKLCGFEAYAPTDNVSELTARTNDEGWSTVFVEWLRGSRLTERDMLFVLSVGGGDLARNISPNLVHALQYAQEVGAAIGGIVGRGQGFTASVADACVVVPVVNPERVTPHAEAFQGLIWHLLVSSPSLQCRATCWESAVRRAA